MFRHDEWAADIVSKLPKNVKIQILYRDKIRVFFKDSQEAKNFNYDDYDTTREKDGYIYAFTGLRGDAKQLYKDVQEGKEKRVALIKAETPNNQLKYV